MNIDHIKKENYQRAFVFKRVGYLLNCFALQHYRQRNFLWIYDNETSSSYIENSAAEKTAVIGEIIFSSEKYFTSFEKGFRGVIEDAKLYINNTRKFEVVTVSDLYNLRDLVCKMYYFYEKTEFFFTDGCYKNEMTEILKKNLLILGDDLKMKGRPVIVELLTTMVYHLAELAANEHGISTDDIKFYGFEELIALLESSIKVESNIIKERQKSFVVYSENGNIFIPSKIEQERILERFKTEDYSQKLEFKGIIANKGKVTARVRVFLAELGQDYNIFIKKLHSMEMNDGEILVTETTSPDFVPFMKKAGGVIANQGGMNSHAAIMSRELKIPCLVGTYHATDILRTGDLVELDADKGIVKILERN